MSVTVNGYTPQALINNVRMIGIKGNFLLDFLIRGQIQMHDQQVVNLAETVSNVRVLPVVGRDEPGTPMAHETGSASAVVAPKLRVRQAFNEEVAEAPLFGGQSFAGMNTDLNLSLMERIARAQQKIKASFEMTKESWLADLLADGAVSLADIDGTARYTLDFGYVTTGTAAARNVQTALTGTDAWNSDQSDPIANLNAWERQIRSYSAYGGKLVVICGYAVEDALRNHPKIQKIFDNRNMNFGQLQAAGANNYIGTLGKFDLYTYTRSSRAAKASTLTELWDEGTAAMVPADGSNFEMHYGAVFEDPAGGGGSQMRFIRTDYYSKFFTTQDPASQILIVESRPIPVITDVRPIRVCKVILD